MNTPKPQQKKNTLNLLASLLDQNNARIYIPANQQSPGYWFGGGNMLSMKPESYGFVGDFVIMVILVLEQMLV